MVHVEVGVDEEGMDEQQRAAAALDSSANEAGV
jgi:hypothetical protein